MVKVDTTFCALSSTRVRVGNFEVRPRGRILTTDQFLQMKVPSVPSVRSSKPEYVTLDIPLREVANVVFHFCTSLNVLFVYLVAAGCRRVREVLGMTSRHSFYLDNTNGQDAAHKRLTLLLGEVTPDDLACLRAQLRGKLFEIPLANARNVLEVSAPRPPEEQVEEQGWRVRVARCYLEPEHLLVVWQEAARPSAPLATAALEVQQQETGVWQVIQGHRYDGAAAEHPMVVRYDAGGAAGRHVFRLRVVDMEGGESYSNTAAIDI